MTYTREEIIDILKNYEMGWMKAQSAMPSLWHDILELLEQEPSDEWQNGYDTAWEEAKVFYEVYQDLFGKNNRPNNNGLRLSVICQWLN